MNSTDTCTGQNSDGQLRNHGHVQNHTVTFLNAHRTHRITKPRYGSMQLSICKRLPFRSGVIGFPLQCNLMPTCFQMPIKGIGCDIDLTIREPSNRPIVHPTRKHIRKWTLPVKMNSDFRPELSRVLCAFFLCSTVTFEAVELQGHDDKTE